MRRGVCSVAALCTCLLVATSLRAREPSAEGEQLFHRGTEAYLRGDYLAAIEALSQAYAKTGRSGLLFSIAQAHRRHHEATGDVAALRQALQHFQRYLSEDPQGSRVQEARSLIQTLAALPDAKDWDRSPTAVPDAPVAAPSVAKLEARLLVLGHDGSLLLVDGARVGTLPLDELRLPAGEHTLELRKHGYFGVEQRVRLRAGEPSKIRMLAPPTTARKAGIGAMIGGAGALLVGGVLAGIAFHEQSTALSLQGDAQRAREYNDALDARNSFRLAAAVSAGIGAVAASAGAYAFYTEGFGPTLSVTSDHSALLGARGTF